MVFGRRAGGRPASRTRSPAPDGRSRSPATSTTTGAPSSSPSGRAARTSSTAARRRRLSGRTRASTSPASSRPPAAIGDVDGDSTPDLLLGGPHAAYVVFAQPGGDVDLDGDFAGLPRSIRRAGRRDPRRSMGAGDLDGDYAPDVALGFRGSAYAVFSPLDQKVV